MTGDGIVNQDVYDLKFYGSMRVMSCGPSIEPFRPG